MTTPTKAENPSALASGMISYFRPQTTAVRQIILVPILAQRSKQP